MKKTLIIGGVFAVGATAGALTTYLVMQKRINILEEYVDELDEALKKQLIMNYSAGDIDTPSSVEFKDDSEHDDSYLETRDSGGHVKYNAIQPSKTIDLGESDYPQDDEPDDEEDLPQPEVFDVLNNGKMVHTEGFKIYEEAEAEELLAMSGVSACDLTYWADGIVTDDSTGEYTDIEQFLVDEDLSFLSPEDPVAYVYGAASQTMYIISYDIRTYNEGLNA